MIQPLSSWPSEAAIIRGVRPSLPAISTLKPRLSNSRIFPKWPYYAAELGGILPYVSIMSTSAPPFRNFVTISTCHFAADHVRIVALVSLAIHTFAPWFSNSRTNSICPSVAAEQGVTKGFSTAVAVSSSRIISTPLFHLLTLTVSYNFYPLHLH